MATVSQPGSLHHTKCVTQLIKTIEFIQYQFTNSGYEMLFRLLLAELRR